VLPKSQAEFLGREGRGEKREKGDNNNNNNDRLTAFDPGQPG